MRSEDDGHPLAVYAIDDNGHRDDDDGNDNDNYERGLGMGERRRLQDRCQRTHTPQPEMGGKDNIGRGRGGGDVADGLVSNMNMAGDE